MMRAIIAGVCLVGCVGLEPPDPDEATCLWQELDTVTAPADRCAIFLGSQDVRISANACEAESGRECLVLHPGESARTYWRPLGDDKNAEVWTGPCGDLTCD